jgi:hypothetical protein
MSKQLFVIAGVCAMAVCFVVAPDARAEPGSSLGGQIAELRDTPQVCRINFGTTPDDTGGSLAPFPAPPGNPLNTQFLKTQFIVFGAAVDSPRDPTTLVLDTAVVPDSDRSSGSPEFGTDWWCQFKDNWGPRHVYRFSANVGFIDAAPGTVLMEAYNNEKEWVASATNTVTGGTETLTIQGVEIGYVRVVSSNDPAGLSVDCLQYNFPRQKFPSIPPLGLIGLGVILAAGGAILVARRRAAATD